MKKKIYESHIGGIKWKISDNIYFKLTGRKIKSEYSPTIPVSIINLSSLIPNKNVYGLFWSTPTFKDTDCQYLFHVYDKFKVDFVISTSSGNTVESMANNIKLYNQKSNKNIRSILLVPEISSHKVSKNVIENNPYVNFIVLKNSTLDSTRNFATKLIQKIFNKYSIVSANEDLKTSAYSQIGYLLDQLNIFSDNFCFVQTVSGGIGPAGVIEYSSQYNINPEILVAQPFSSKSTPIIDALKEHSLGRDPFKIFNKNVYETSDIEPTLGSSRPIYAIEKFIQYREGGGKILGVKITEEDISKFKNILLNTLVKVGIYPRIELALKFFQLEKSGIIAFIGAIKSANRIESKNIIVNFTGRSPETESTLPISANPHVFYNPAQGVDKLIKILNI
ncbi:MAG: hypothetical protein ACFE9S_10380 [Candidatus Hermodarchaeota archaeon]